MVDKWTNPTAASLRGDDSRPLQQTFSSLSTYLDKLDGAITAAAASGVTSLTAGTGIGLSGGTGVVTVSNTGVTGLTGTANQVTVSAGTGSVTLSLPQNIHTGATPTFSSLTLNGGTSTYSAGNSSYITFGPNASWGAYLRVGSTSNVAGVGVAQVISTDGNLHLDSGTNNNIYLNYYSSGRPINVYGSINMQTNSTGYYQTSTSTWSGNPTNGIGKFEYHSNRWYIGAGPDSTEILRIRRGGTDEVVISNDGQVYAYGYRGNENVGGTGEASWHPAGIYSNGQNWLYGAVHLNGNNINGCGTIYTSNWFRSTGGSGWYNESYGGGIWMSDSTWIRTYNGKNFYCDAEIRSNNPFTSNNTNNGANLRTITGNLTFFGWYGYYAIYIDSTHVKTFVINHPTKSDNYLVHACAEGPTADVFYRGEGQLQNGICVVTLPDYFEELTEISGRSVMVTPIADENGPAANLAAYEIENGQFVVEQIGGFHVPYQRFWWRVDAVRKGTAFDVEPLKSETEVSGDGPYTYARKKAA